MRRGVARWGGTHSANHSLSLSLRGPEGREQGAPAGRDSVGIIVIPNRFLCSYAKSRPITSISEMKKLSQKVKDT